MEHEVDPKMRDPDEMARRLITAMASGDAALARSQVMEAVIEREPAACEREHGELAELVEALARHALFLASLPGEVLLTLGHDNVPVDLVERFGDRQSTLQTAWQRVAE